MQNFKWFLPLLMACASLAIGCKTAVSTASLEGTWRFAYETQGAPPPAIDQIEFHGAGQATLSATLAGRQYQGTYSYTGEWLDIRLPAENGKQPAGDISRAIMGLGGNSLVLRRKGSEQVFYRAKRFLKDELAGVWQLRGEREQMTLGEDGAYHSGDGRAAGYYRLWPSRIGPAMTLVFNAPTTGPTQVNFLFTRSRETLTLTPIQDMKPMQYLAETWTLVK